ncbi:hypothetical protein A5733_26055 [Mycobacterium sp. NS-7484]|uniref:hypothetical protein n=1 Tax=Mycobacterium sp. NS-7484 TaxID=1834161 RepID=UPI00096F8F75|nr:hypothetical protein [Mycobacterium sp. NS-7484]OMC02152.1 hypothetical protein A5733_26055 [Mycobacterium sp. NS-7484]
MSALSDTVANFRALGAAAARLVADVLDGPELLGHDYDVPATDEETRRAEGTQHAQTPGEVSADPSPDPAPSPGDLPDSALFEAAAQYALEYSLLVDDPDGKADAHRDAALFRDRAAQFAALESLDTQ